IFIDLLEMIDIRDRNRIDFEWNFETAESNNTSRKEVESK
ncbi:unnamed protein product, partial [Rotaria magnacalcarata]